MSLVVVDGQKVKIVVVPRFICQNSQWVSSIDFRVEFGWSAAGVLHKFDLHPQKSLVVKSAVRQGYALPPRALELSKRPAYHSKIQVNMKFVDLLEDMTQVPSWFQR